MSTGKTIAAVSPLMPFEAIATFDIQINGMRIPDGFMVLSVEVRSMVNSISSAAVVLHDGEDEFEEFTISSSSVFVPGCVITVSAGYDTKNVVIFSGQVTSQNARYEPGIGSVLEIKCDDAAIAMDVEKRNQNFTDLTDSAIISSIITKNYRIDAKITPTAYTHPQVVQYAQTDWDFIVSRAKNNSMVVVNKDGTLVIAKPDNTTPSILTVTNGESLIDFNCTWQPGLSSEVIFPELSRVSGSVKFQGSALAVVGSMISVADMGSRFSGDHYVSGVIHRIANGEWQTEVAIGMPVYKSSMLPGYGNSGILSSANSLFTGLVKKTTEDPDKMHRVLVELPLMNEFSAGIWARVANFYATDSAGSFFMPEVGDEVLVGFINQDPAYPVVLGSLYDTIMHTPGAAIDPATPNTVKAIISKSGLSLTFNDTTKTLQVKTAANNTITLNDTKKEIVIIDQNANSITLSETGIEIKSAKDISLIAGGNITTTSQGNTNIVATQDVSITALNITNAAKMGFTAKGAATSEVSASGQLTLKGGMVIIN